MQGAEETDWDVTAAGPGWGLNHNDVPDRPDKMGWLFEYERERERGERGKEGSAGRKGARKRREARERRERGSEASAKRMRAPSYSTSRSSRYDPEKGGAKSDIVFAGIEGSHISLGFLKTYGDAFGAVSCRVDQGEMVTVNPIWEAQVSMVDWQLFEVAEGVHTITCSVDLTTNPLNFKVLAISAC
jgi:hypothetical protein